MRRFEITPEFFDKFTSPRKVIAALKRKGVDVTDLVDYIEKRKRIKKRGVNRFTTVQVIKDFYFGDKNLAPSQPVKKEIRRIMRKGSEWISTRKALFGKFDTSEFTKKYKNLDEFVTFAPDEEVNSVLYGNKHTGNE